MPCPRCGARQLVGGPNVSDEEIGTGVEDLQFRIGADVDGDGALDSFFDPGTLPVAGAACLRADLAARAGVERTGATAASDGASYADRNLALRSTMATTACS